ncbi:hypothetical protein J6590_009952 [Homalodisca vitripennis]|nr:hypothetical protein J6590_009952 [Homalodisca vitripennis]
MADDLCSQDIRNVLEEQMSDVSDSDIRADNFPDDYNSNPGAGHSLQRLPGRQERLCIVCGHTKKGEDQDSSVQDAILVFIESVSINWIIFGDQSIKGGRESMIVVVPKSEWKDFFHMSIVAQLKWIPSIVESIEVAMFIGLQSSAQIGYLNSVVTNGRCPIDYCTHHGPATFHDLYSDWVVTVLNVSLLAETWPNGPGRLNSSCKYPFRFEKDSEPKVETVGIRSDGTWACWGIRVVGTITREQGSGDRDDV